MMMMNRHPSSSSNTGASSSSPFATQTKSSRRTHQPSPAPHPLLLLGREGGAEEDGEFGEPPLPVSSGSSPPRRRRTWTTSGSQRRRRRRASSHDSAESADSSDDGDNDDGGLVVVEDDEQGCRRRGRAADPNSASATMVQELVAALSEAQTELRDAKRESEALQETCHALSQSLQESEESRNELMGQLELLQLQMSSVCYVDLPILRKHHSDNDEATKGTSKDGTTLAVQHPPKEKIQKKKATVLSAQPSVVAGPTNTSGSTAQAATGVEMDDVMPRAAAQVDIPTADDIDVSVAPAATSSASPISPSLSPPASASASATATATAPAPSQAAFYRVLAERDQARRSAEMLRQEVKVRREQVKTLRRQLLQSATLIELSYTPQDADVDGLDSDDDDSTDDCEYEVMDNTASSTSSPSKTSSPLKKWLMNKRGDRRTPSSSTASPPIVSPESAPTRQREPPALSGPSSPPFASDADDDDVGRNGEKRPGASALFRPTPEEVGPAASSNIAITHDDPAPSLGLKNSLNDQYIVDLFQEPNDTKRFGRSPSPDSLSSSTSSSDADAAAGGFVSSWNAEMTNEKESYRSETLVKGDSPRRRPVHHHLRPSELAASSPLPEHKTNVKVSPRAVKGKLVEL